MDRWKSRNLLNRRDAFEIRRELEYIRMSLSTIQELLEQNTEVNKKSMTQILKQCIDNNDKSTDIETLLKVLMIDSLTSEVKDEKIKRIN